MEGFSIQGTFPFSGKENVYRIQSKNGAGTKGKEVVGPEYCKAIVLQEMGHLLQKTILRPKTGY
tara:strand:+ start:2351 stop:2542 length:192 start_codon:yes stop_codon:yes gene_type:complete